MNKVNEINDLASNLKCASDAYYNEQPIMSDADFDLLRDKLEKLNPEHPFLTEVGATIKKDGAWPEHQHRTLMGSLSKIAPDRNNINQIQTDFYEWCEGKGDEFLLSEKYDGSTVVATYENGKLTSLATRGNGEIGENVTPNARVIRNVPLNLQHDFSGEIRGEAMLRISAFEKYFRPAGSSNPRNAANGKVRDSKDDDRKANIEVMWFDIIPTDRDVKTEAEKWRLIGLLGLGSGCQMLVTKEIAWKVYETYRDPNDFGDPPRRAMLDYEIDGLVIKVNDIDLQESFGVTSSRPKGAVALKFPSEEKTTIIKDIKWNRGLTGVWCPIAHMEPVEIGGVTITKASLCGIEEIRRLNVAIGDEVIVSRRNDVIPKIERVLIRASGRPEHQPPTHCDLCNEKLTKDGAYILCINSECQGEIYGNLMTWIKELRIKGIGPSVLRGLIAEGVTDINDLYRAGPSIYEAACNSKKNGDKRHAAVRASEKMRLSAFLSALNIRALGTTNGQRLEKKFKTLEAVMNASIEDFQSVPGIKTNAKKIHAGLREKATLIGELYYLQIQNLDDSGPLAGKSFCITGNLSIPRPKVQDWIKSHGGEVKSGVGKTLSYLVTDDPSSGTGKSKKADKYEVSKITEDQLYELVGTRPG